MSEVCVRCYEELNAFLSPARQKVSFPYAIEQGMLVKHIIEALGLPPAAVDLILVNGQSVDFDYPVRGGDRISLYPVFEAFDIRGLAKLAHRPLRDTRFIADAYLGRLAMYLRILGFDTVYETDYPDDEWIRLSCNEKRIVLTRDRALLERTGLQRGYWVHEPRPRDQLLAVLRRFDLFGSVRPLGRCLDCNGRLQPIEKERIANRLAPAISERFQRYWVCDRCGLIYWPGAYYRRRLKFIQTIVNVARSDRAGSGD